MDINTAGLLSPLIVVTLAVVGGSHLDNTRNCAILGSWRQLLMLRTRLSSRVRRKLN
jgi:hypothetical protein